MPIRAILMDIEGTTSDIQFVHQVLFPYARQKLADYIEVNQHQPEVAKIIEQVKIELPSNAELTQVIDLMHQWIDEDKKAPPLKNLQGLIWQGGYSSGELKGHIYPDVLEQLKQWHQDHISLAIYSSGSVKAQQLLFKHSDFGDLTALLTHYFDTAVGHKQQTDSYQQISQAMDIAPQEILFLSDILAELDAARSVGMHTLQLRRDQQATADHPFITDFIQIDLNQFGAPA